MTRLQRFLVIAVILVATSLGGFYILARHIRAALVDRPYIAAVKTELRALAVAQDSLHAVRSTFATEIAAIRSPRSSVAGVQLEIVRADSSGFVAEGRHDSWTGRCVVALGRYAADSLIPGEPKCQR